MVQVREPKSSTAPRRTFLRGMRDWMPHVVPRCFQIQDNALATAIQIFLQKSVENVEPKPQYRKIIWKVTYKADSLLPALSTSPIQPPLPTPTDEKCKNNKEAKNTMKIYSSEKYTWEEYDHSEIFEEPDNPDDQDYDPEIED